LVKRKRNNRNVHSKKSKTYWIPDVIRNLNVIFNLEINGLTIPFERNIVYKFNDDAKGEIYQPVDIVPVVTSELNNKVYIFNNDRSKTITRK
jgi:hypothetical protein